MDQVAILEASYDRSMPAGALEQARIAVRRRPAGGYIGKATLKPAGIIAAMAQTMRMLAGISGSFTYGQLLGAGYSPTEIARYAEQANRMRADLSEHGAGADREQLMAEAMLDIAARSGGCTERDLVAIGFTAPEILQHGDAAIQRAALLAVQEG